MTNDPEEQAAKVIADTIARWLNDDTPTAGIASDIIEALDEAGFCLVEYVPIDVVLGEDALTLNAPDIAANDISLPIEGWLPVPDGIEPKD